MVRKRERNRVHANMTKKGHVFIVLSHKFEKRLTHLLKNIMKSDLITL